MRGIIGLFLTDPALEPELGRLTAGMLAVMADRGPDSAGFCNIRRWHSRYDETDTARTRLDLSVDRLANG
jgi:hypothetical protein